MTSLTSYKRDRLVSAVPTVCKKERWLIVASQLCLGYRRLLTTMLECVVKYHKARWKERKMFEIEGLTKETLYAVMRDLLYSLNYGWFRLEELLTTKDPEMPQSEEYLGLIREFGSYEVKRLSKTLNLSGGGIDSLVELLKHSHWAVFENIEAKKLTEKSFRMRTIECSAQKAAKRWGMEYYDCKLGGSAGRAGFFGEANQNVKIQRIFAPPEIRPGGTPENVSCEWLISIEEE